MHLISCWYQLTQIFETYKMQTKQCRTHHALHLSTTIDKKVMRDMREDKISAFKIITEAGISIFFKNINFEKLCCDKSYPLIGFVNPE